MTKRFQALEMGFVDGKRVRPGEEFTANDKFTASWAVELPPAEDEKPKAKRSAKKPKAEAENSSGEEQADDLA